MKVRRFSLILGVACALFALADAAPARAQEFKGTVESVDLKEHKLILLQDNHKKLVVSVLHDAL